jgi:drug/metabolite transporter (DMT)-like permease
MTLRHGQAVVLMVAVALLWSTAVVVTRQLEQAQAFEITFWRSAFTALSLAVILPVWQGADVWRRLIGNGGWLGSLVALGAPLGGAFNWNLVQRSLREGQGVDLVPAVLLGALLSAAVTLPLAWPWQASAHDVAWLAGLGLFQLALPCVLAVVCARVLKPAEVSLLALLEVLFGILLAWIGAGEVPSPAVWQGGALVLGALFAHLGWTYRKETFS